MMKPIGYLFFRWRSVVALLVGILVATLMLFAVQSERSHAQTTGPTALSVAAGYQHSLAVGNSPYHGSGVVWAWGDNTNGQIGNGNGNNYDTGQPVKAPVLVHGSGDVGYLSGVTKVAAGFEHSLALKSDGTVWAWGDNYWGQLGCHSNSDHYTPVQVHGPGNVGYLTDVVDIAAGYHHSLAVTKDGSVYAWGGGFQGQLGLHSNNDHTIPYQVHGLGNVGYLTGIEHVAAGQLFSLAVDNDGHVYAWGEGSQGQLGINSHNDHTVPYQVHGPGNVDYLTDVTQVAAGRWHSLALKSDGTVWAWGDNTDGQLGQGPYESEAITPALVSPNTGLYYGNVVTKVAAGYYHSLAIRDDGSAWAWGENVYGALGNGHGGDSTYDRSEPTRVTTGTGLTGVVDVAGGEHHSLAVKSDGTVWAWGFNEIGQLGTNSTNDHYAPVQVSPLPGATQEEDGPLVTHVVPPDGATNVPRGRPVSATFSEKMDEASIERPGTFTLEKEATATPVAAKVKYNAATDKATLRPEKPLEKGTAYTAAVSTQAKDLQGNALEETVIWSFKVKG
jgi:alpha-tubulin suppressor-like RCC1 family protein